MPTLAELAMGVRGGVTQSPQPGTVIETASGPMVVLPDGRVVPLPMRGGIPGVNGAMPPSGTVSPPVVMPTGYTARG